MKLLDLLCHFAFNAVEWISYWVDGSSLEL